MESWAVVGWGEPRGRQGQPGLAVPLAPGCWMLRFFILHVSEVDSFSTAANG